MVADRSVVRNLPALCEFGRYELLGRLAVGGMAEIFLAREREYVQGAGHRHLVIKRVLPHVANDAHFQDMFFDEARLATRLSHPAIVHIYEFGEEEGSTYLAMEWVDGVALGKLIRKSRSRGGIPVPACVKIASTVAEALHYAHHLRGDDGQPLHIVHRDVSPQNIMVSMEGAVKLLDFGIAKATDQLSRTNDGQVKGKFAYMAPEQCVGDGVDARADVFALGVCLYESLTGRPLFHRKTQYETMKAVLDVEPPSIRDYREGVSADLERIVMKALEKDREDRYQNAGEFQLDLERWLVRNGEIVPAMRLAEFVQQVTDREQVQVDSAPFASSFPRLPDMAGKVREPTGPHGLLTAEASLQVNPVHADGSPVIDSSVVDGAVVSVANGAIVPSPSAMTTTHSGPADAVIVEPAQESTKSPALAWTVALLLLAALVGVFSAVLSGVFDSEPPIAETPIEAQLVLVTEPPGAEVLVDGASRGMTPLTLSGLAAGRHRLEIRREGFEPVERALELRAGAETNLGFELTPQTNEAEQPSQQIHGSATENQGEAQADETDSASLEAPTANTSTMRSTMRTSRRSNRQNTMSAEMASETSESVMESSTRATGRVAINTRPWSQVYQGNRHLGTTPLGGVELPAGSVRLRFTDRDGNDHTRTVQVREGELTRQFFDFSGSE